MIFHLKIELFWSFNTTFNNIKCKKFIFLRILCETIRDFTLRLAHTTLTQGDELFSEKCQTLNHKLDMLVQTLEDESEAAKICKVIETTEKGKVSREKQEKDIINFREKSVSSIPEISLTNFYNCNSTTRNCRFCLSVQWVLKGKHYCLGPIV